MVQKGTRRKRGSQGESESNYNRGVENLEDIDI